MGGLADIFSGGSDTDAQNTLSAALQDTSEVNNPSATQLTLPQLQAYVQAGILTPEQAQAFTVGNNAFDTTTADNAGMQDELSTIGQLQDIVNQGGNDAQEKADIQGILNTLGTTESGQNAAIDRGLAAQGIDNSGFQLAEKLAGNQNEATAANTNALGAGANAEARQLAALNAEGTLGGNVQGQQYTQAENKANAANAIVEFNAQQKQQTNQLNTTEENEAQAANLANAQNVSNLNTQTAQTQEESIPAAQQEAYEDALAKASAESDAGENLANQETQTGQQNAGIAGGLISAAGTVGAAELAGNPYTALATALANNSVPNANVSTNSSPATVSTGGQMTPKGDITRPVQNMKTGGPVPGIPVVPGDSPANDTQLAKLSPGEIVLPRSVTQPRPDPARVMQFLKSLPHPQQKTSVHPRAVLDTLRALNAHHSGVI
jgi:hypothetical protein